MSESLNQNLFTRIAIGDKQAFNKVFFLFSSPLRIYVTSIVKNEQDAMDVLQELFLKVWVKKESLVHIENPSAWLYETAFNGALNHIRKEQNRKRLLTEWEYHCAKQELSGEEALQAKQLREIMEQGIDQLPGQRKLIYKMSEEQLLTRKQIAKELDISEHTVKNQLYTASQFLREYVARHAGATLPLSLLLFIFRVIPPSS